MEQQENLYHITGIGKLSKGDNLDYDIFTLSFSSLYHLQVHSCNHSHQLDVFCFDEKLGTVMNPDTY